MHPRSRGTPFRILEPVESRESIPSIIFYLHKSDNNFGISRVTKGEFIRRLIVVASNSGEGAVMEADSRYGPVANTGSIRAASAARRCPSPAIASGLFVRAFRRGSQSTFVDNHPSLPTMLGSRNAFERSTHGRDWTSRCT